MISHKNFHGFPIRDTSSLSDLIEQTSILTKNWRRRWFRGVEGDFRLESGIFRATNEFEEDYIVKSFCRMGGIFVPNLDPADDVSAVCLAQHYGLPTRLLDWTESLTVALFFAFDNWKKRKKSGLSDKDLFVWCLNPVLLNIVSERKLAEINKSKHATAIVSCLEEQSDRGVLVADSARIRHLAQFSFQDEDEIKDRDEGGNPDTLPVAFYPHFFDKRISLQRSCFTIQGRSDEPLDAQLQTIFHEDIDQALLCFRLSVNSIKKIEQEFQVISPTPTTILGDVEGLVKEILEYSGNAGDED